ncbi:MAG: DUF3326 domain-containing protein [Candidatus Gastranaerophilales bacterium]|nr:DUF3326 domain-containing protein [Candidatus Gastranaerophilales bacterium]
MKPVVAISVPTGIGADIGGYAGDFGYLAREFAKDFYTIINPNAVNGGILSAINYDMAYLEGYLFDEFFKGNISINPKKPHKTNKIGVIFDCAIPQNIINVHLNTLSALRMVQGIEISAIEYTKTPVGVELQIDNGISTGRVNSPDTILKSAQNLLKKGIEAIALVCYFGEDSEDINYSNAQGIDPIGGIEAVLSHLITKEFNIVSAHAPAFSDIDVSQKIEHPKVASELISSTYLPCVMQGLSIAPSIKKGLKGEISYKNVEYLIVPYDALGSPAVLSSIKHGVKLITIKNETVLDVTAQKLNIKPYAIFDTYEQCLKNLKNKILNSTKKLT